MRAWTLQERLVSRRIIHFATKKVLFECRTLDASAFNYKSRNHMFDTVPIFLILPDELRIVGFYNSLQYRLGARDTGPKEAHWIRQAYYTLVEIYSRRKLTFVEDRVSVFSAIVQMTEDMLNEVVFHGLILMDLRHGLLWSKSQQNSPKLLRSLTAKLESFPSWSWQSSLHAVKFPRSKYISLEVPMDISSRIPFCIPIEVDSSMQTPVNNRLHSRLEICAPVVEVFLEWSESRKSRYSTHVYNIVRKDGRQIAKSQLDYIPDPAKFVLDTSIRNINTAVRKCHQLYTYPGSIRTDVEQFPT